jgi:tryptophanyl-tRNA synthetase
VYQLCKLFLTPEEDEALRAKYLKGWLSFKEAKDYLFEKIMETLTPIQKKYAEISDEEIIKILKKWKESVSPIAEKKVEDVYKKVGFILG